MASISDGTTTWTYTYDANGMRTQRSNGTDTYRYIYNGSHLTCMTKGSDTLYFSYDADGHPFTLIHNGTTYYYIVSPYGTVDGILDSTGTLAVYYDYDAWGNLVGTGGTMANTLGVLNPLRYRSYVYDNETELYYLQSRYYDPEIGRFINADGFVSTGQGILGNNMFAYCNNNPVSYYDSSGRWTMGFSVGANITAILGASASIGFFWDDNGNCEFQWSYSLPGVDDTMTTGGLSAGVGVSFQYTDRDSIDALYGAATAYGASGGPGWYVGGDLISFADASDVNGEINGVQLVAGIGVGLDAHVAETYTRRVRTGVNNNTFTSYKQKVFNAKFNRYAGICD